MGFNRAGGILLLTPFLLGKILISPFVYHTTDQMASNFLRDSGIPCLLYIDARHNGKLQVALDNATLNTVDDRHLAAARSAMFLVAYHFVRLGYFLGLQTSMLFPSKTVPYLGFLADSSREVFCLKFFNLSVKYSRIPRLHWLAALVWEMCFL